MILTGRETFDVLGDPLAGVSQAESRRIKRAVAADNELEAAVATRDERQIQQAANRVTDLNVGLLKSRKRWAGSPFGDEAYAAALLAGRGTEFAGELRERLVDLDQNYRLADVAEEQWWPGLSLTRANLRLIERDWRPLDGFPRAGKYLGSPQRHRVVRRQDLLDAFGARDAARTKRLLQRLATEPGNGWLLAWALYREATALGMELAIPRFHSGELSPRGWGSDR